MMDQNSLAWLCKSGNIMPVIVESFLFMQVLMLIVVVVGFYCIDTSHILLNLM
jgi:hypothetical protein